MVLRAEAWADLASKQDSINKQIRHRVKQPKGIHCNHRVKEFLVTSTNAAAAAAAAAVNSGSGGSSGSIDDSNNSSRNTAAAAAVAAVGNDDLESRQCMHAHTQKDIDERSNK